MARETSYPPFKQQPTEWLKGSVLGSGSHGIVHLAIDSSTGALFVSKSAKSKSGVVSLKNEAEILESLSSPHIVRYFGKDTSPRNGESRLSLFFEHMAGGSLSDLAKKFGGSLDEKVIRLYTREILHGLKYLHENGIVHSDVKCKNVLLGSSGNVKLADFGCAKWINKSKIGTNSCDSIGGTPLWMSPEALRQEEIGFSADIWSLGCTVIEMATGRPPWDCCEAMIFLKIAKGTDVPKFPVNFSPEGLDFLGKCLVRDPRKRWTSEELLTHPFVTGSVSPKGGMFSPTSVLNLAVYDSDDEGGGGGGVNRGGCGCDLESSDSWITVR